MSLAAILSATAPCSDRRDDARAHLVFAAQTLIEYQARQAMQAGADQLFLMIDAVTPAMSRLVDRLGADGAQLHLVRDMAGLIRQLPRESDILLFADGMVVDQHYVRELAKERGNALLVAPDDTTTAHLERVDATHRWAGVARISPQTLFNTLDLIGDWDLVLTLLRAVVQNDPRRIPVAPADLGEGRVAMVDNQATADLVGRQIASSPVYGHAGGGVERYLLWPIARLVATRLLRMQIGADQLHYGAVGLAILGLACLWPGWGYACLLLLMLAVFTGLIAEQVADMSQRPGAGKIVSLVPILLITAGIAGLGSHFGAWADGLYLALLSATMALALRVERVGRVPGWALMTPATALLILLGGLLLGRPGPAMALGAVLAVVSVAAVLLLPSLRNEGHSAR